jgi:hypothetical protein
LSEPKYFSISFLVAALSMSPAIAMARVVRRVILPEEISDVFELRGLDVGVRSDDDAVVRMPCGNSA